MSKTAKQNIDNERPATRKDVEDIVSSVVAEALKIIESQFIKVDQRFEGIDERLDDLDHNVADLRTDMSDLRLGQARMEKKLDRTINQMNALTFTSRGHDRQLRKLRPKIA